MRTIDNLELKNSGPFPFRIPFQSEIKIVLFFLNVKSSLSNSINRLNVLFPRAIVNRLSRRLPEFCNNSKHLPLTIEFLKQFKEKTIIGN